MAQPSTALFPAEERPDVAQIRESGRTAVLVIGGGINGLATFRDLAMQGIDVVLVERNDFASGSTAASSHMIHGGLRYLENGELRLVRESVHERNSLLRIAPHFVRPLKTTIPIYSTFSGLIAAPLRVLRHQKGKRASERGAAIIKMGLTIYDTFSRDNGSVPRHQFHGRKRSLEQLPQLNPEVKYTATYFDASVHSPERLALDVMLDGVRAGERATAVNYVEAVAMTDQGVTLRDRETGVEFDLTADVVVNASGPWTDLTNGALGRDTTFMGGTKGSHIVLDNEELLAATDGREIFFEHKDGRIVLVYPLHGRVLVGTTDLEADPRDDAVCTNEEIDYFFNLLGEVFPSIQVERSQIVFTYSGIRPLPHHDAMAPGLVSRDYSIEEEDGGAGPTVLSLVGGKWTTFRALGETLSSRVLEILGRPRASSTDGVAIGGAVDFPTDPSVRTDWFSTHLPRVESDRREVLLARYGSRASDVADYVETDVDRLIAGCELSSREVDYMVRHEYARTVADVVLRRTNLAFMGLASGGVITQIADAMAGSLSWDASRTAHEISRCEEVLRTLHSVPEPAGR
ncbi:glycerol-3-phosphate dehydrogenase/oxidase [Demequina aurantiaca]|uniref:glycerol-3-phosphate dehydrogenase/oxidase n=1 Tax=Demequina aurantiaca TaxID=676200 RepID=UPI0007839C71|nr:glycerol-3-phosphate dehydrogenase/oxidase [Demequina aurantiaca]